MFEDLQHFVKNTEKVKQCFKDAKRSSKTLKDSKRQFPILLMKYLHSVYGAQKRTRCTYDVLRVLQKLMACQSVCQWCSDVFTACKADVQPERHQAHGHPVEHWVQLESRAHPQSWLTHMQVLQGDKLLKQTSDAAQVWPWDIACWWCMG